MLCYVMLCYGIIVVLYCIYLASACLLNETIRINSLVHFTCSLQGVICRPIYHYIFSMPIARVSRSWLSSDVG